MQKAKNKWLPIIILVVIGFVLYLPSLFGKFLWDDEDFVYANNYVAEFRLDKLLTDSITSGRGKASNYYRPIQGALYALAHTFFGFNPAPFHLLNVIFHLAAALAIYSFFLLFSKNKTVSLFTALFFLVHPVQTEAVSYVSGLSDPLYVFFGFLSLIYFRKSVFHSLIFFLLSLLSKETGLVFLGLICLLWFFDQKPRKFINLVPYFILAFCYIVFHFSFINEFDVRSAWGNSAYADSVIIRLSTFFQNFFLYLQVAFSPKDLFMERDFSIHLPSSIFTFSTFSFLAINITTICFLWLNRQKTNFKLLLFSYLSLICSFLPASGLFLINGIFYEHFLYLPLVFIFSFLLFLFPKNIPRLTLSLLSIYLVAISIRTVIREFDWIDPIRFYEQTLDHAPKSIRVGNNLGMAYSDRGSYDQAIDIYQKTINLNDKVPNLYHNLANVYQSKGDYKTAEKSYQQAIVVDPNFFYSYVSLVNLYRQSKDSQKEVNMIALIKSRFPNLIRPQ